ncbi:Eco57I restriction-modification methylase domain-containing protein [Flavobacterium capsici]|uniref:site-specific DNA-methyltransferase (adenine-specific) n=1 Tax=Flavobacterium capsici TaxID=3075618 RepID=A0AA96J430_9FLAO|nr:MULTISPECIES: Eco57I restriction-modification methylase domain-containing protein [unclassified Flavobacterium]WNM19491.1 Eco57I restriction-modification methylase domain-containing protein [Flavobacterium sp. PMR2A8]WNM20880.1 Eco57I restriction-modification methylase domain-containing protein [Flavobacterium sp. PMTSA4]
MNQNIIKYLEKYSSDTKDVNRLLVSSFLSINKIYKVNNVFINNYIIHEDEELEQLDEFLKLLNKEVFDIEELIEFFEFVISPKDKEVNGAVFTPEYIRKYIVENTLNNQSKKDSNNLKFGDIACGCGGFFKTITESLKIKTDKTYFNIYKDNIFGLDIQEYSVVRTKILLCLLAIINNEDCEEFQFNLYCGNALSHDWNIDEQIKKNNGFDVIVGNPPYVGATKIDSETKKLLKNWNVSKSGKSDLYIPFFEIGLENLKEDGILGYITVNTFYKSLNGRSVRSYFSRNKFDFTIIDFRGEQLFKNRSTYTCICLISKLQSTTVKYTKSNSKDIFSIKKSNFISIPYSELNDFDGWFLIDKKTKKIITKIESTGQKLGNKFEIRNGFATLKNNVYVFTPTGQNDEFYFMSKDKIEYRIEKSICRDAIKPNTLKLASEIENQTEKLIFPYIIENLGTNLFKEKRQTLKIIDEKTLKSKYSNTYKYLNTQKEILSKRDKGKRKYEEWYAFGRNQALLISGYKLLLPYITSEPCFVYTENQDLLFYNGYAIFSDSIEELHILQKILMSKIFWFYIETTSKPYAGDYFSVAKNYIKNFGICDLNENEKKQLLKLNDINEIDKFLILKYEIEI